MALHDPRCNTKRPQTLAELRAAADRAYPIDAAYPARSDYFHGHYTRKERISAFIAIGMTPSMRAEAIAEAHAKFGGAA